jgi:hypothetical protein
MAEPLFSWSKIDQNSRMIDFWNYEVRADGISAWHSGDALWNPSSKPTLFLATANLTAITWESSAVVDLAGRYEDGNLGIIRCHGLTRQLDELCRWMKVIRPDLKIQEERRNHVFTPSALAGLIGMILLLACLAAGLYFLPRAPFDYGVCQGNCPKLTPGGSPHD